MFFLDDLVEASDVSEHFVCLGREEVEFGEEVVGGGHIDMLIVIEGV